MKQVFKFGTGQEIPEGAIYLGTVKQTEIYNPNATAVRLQDDRSYKVEVVGAWEKCWFVWHYFLVEIK